MESNDFSQFSFKIPWAENAGQSPLFMWGQINKSILQAEEKMNVLCQHKLPHTFFVLRIIFFKDILRIAARLQ